MRSDDQRHRDDDERYSNRQSHSQYGEDNRGWSRRDQEYGRGGRRSLETGYGGYSGEYGFTGDKERYSGYGGGRGHGYGTGAGLGGQAGGFDRGDTGRDGYQRSGDFEDEYGRAYGESGFVGGCGRGAYPERPRTATLPKGYQRSDERIREDICESLGYSGLDVSEVSVEVANGEVTLSGTVKHRRDKHAIEDHADHCMGVQDVHNHIRVEQQASGFQSQDSATASTEHTGKASE